MPLYSDKELQKAKDILEQCDNVAPSTKGCYSSRIALWLHYCNKHLNGDDRVTEVSLTNYVEWMVVSGAAESIRQGATHIQQVLRNQLQGVMCYWRLQNKHNSDAQDPRQQQLFNEKWQMLIMRYPQPRHARRTEPIYGARRMSTPPSGALETSPKAPNTVSRIGYMQDNSPPRAQAIGMRQPHIMPNGAPARTVVPTSAVSNILGIAAGQPQHTGSAHMGYTQPAARQLYPKSPRFGSHPAGHQILHAQHPYTNGNAGHPQDMSPRRPSQTTSLAPLTSRTPADYPSRPSLPPSMQSLAPLQGAPRPTVRPLSQQHTPINGASDALAAQRSGSHQSLLSDTGAQQMYGSHKLDGAHYSRPASAGVSSQLDATLVSAPASPKPKALAEKARPGVLPEELPVWEGQKTPEGHLLNANEALALSIRLLGAKEGVETQVHAHSMLGLATWIPEVTRSALTLADLSIDKTFGTEPRAQNGDTAADKIDAEAGPEQPSLKAITISLKDGKAVALRHSNPLLCPWGTLAMWLFSRWHVANEGTPDFSTVEWQTQRLFSGIAAGSAATDTDFQHLAASALSEISNDKIDGTQAMGDIGFFFAEAFDLVKPTTTGIKGLGTVDAINTQTLRPEVAVAIARVNAGYDAKVDEPLKTPKRFDVIPPQSLQKELFPWLKTVLIDALRQTTNSDDAQASRRILQVLRELRVVLLQDAAFLMEIPSLAEVVKSNPLFGHPLFSSADFVAFREEMRNAIGEAGVKSMDELCTGALQWVAERKAEMPEGADTRMNPTAPILPSPSPTPVLPSNTPMEVDGERKRSRDLDDLLLPSETNGAAANTADASQLPKRHRYDQATNGSTGRIFGDATNGTVTPSPLVQTQTSPRAEPVSSITSKLLADLRSENNDLKAQLRRLEWVLSQHKAEVRSWMGKIEKSVREISLSSKSSMTPPIEQPQHYVYGANPAGRPGVPMAKAVPQRSQIVSQMSVQPHEMSPQLQRYPVGQHVPSAQSNGSSRPMGPPQAVREGMVSYERQPHMPADYRSSAPAIPSSRNPAYGSQVPPAAEYADPRFAGKYSSAPQYAASSGYEHAERSWYQKPRDSAYPPNQPPSMYGMHPHGSPY